MHDSLRVRFASWAFEANTRTLRLGSEPVHISPKAFRLLELLIRRSPDAVSKQEIRRALWPDTHVSESNLTKLAREVRSVLADDAKRPRFVRTVHGYGYAFMGPLVDGSTHRVETRARLVWNGRTFHLQEGHNEIGRTDESALHVDAPTISRRHARITIRGSRATLEDLGSKNGTFVRGERLTGPRDLRYGDLVHLGSEQMTFDRLPRLERTRTGGPA